MHESTTPVVQRQPILAVMDRKWYEYVCSEVVSAQIASASYWRDSQEALQDLQTLRDSPVTVEGVAAAADFVSEILNSFEDRAWYALHARECLFSIIGEGDTSDAHSTPGS